MSTPEKTTDWATATTLLALIALSATILVLVYLTGAGPGWILGAGLCLVFVCLICLLAWITIRHTPAKQPPPSRPFED